MRRTQDELLPSIVRQGRYLDRLYGVGTFDSGLGLYARRSALEAAGVRIPTGPEDAWTGEEFVRVLESLAARDPDGMVLDLKLNYSGEWFTYAFSPLLQSAGGDLIDRSDYQSAGGVLNGPQSVAAMQALQSWFTRGLRGSQRGRRRFCRRHGLHSPGRVIGSIPAMPRRWVTI